ncbi:MAG: hypothetical protein ACJKTH_03070 [Patescibacteria group bacterium UBA2163]
MTHTRTHEIDFDLEKKVCLAVGALLIGIALLYTYFITASVAHVVTREEFAYKTINLTENVAQLEREYMTRSIAITQQNAIAFGLVPTYSSTFVERRTFTFRDSR